MTTVYYNYFRGQWLLCQVTPEQIEILVTKGKLTRQEADDILATPRDC